MLNQIRLLTCLYCLLIAGSLAAGERHLYTLRLRHALPEQVLPILRSQLSADSSLSGYGQQLILNATAAEYESIGTLLEQIDRAPRSLRISVRARQSMTRQSDAYQLRGSAGNTHRPGSTQRQTQTRIVVHQALRQQDRDGVQQVRTVEGMAAFINNGTIYAQRNDSNGSSQTVPVTSGFYATARLLDDNEVVVEIDQHRQQPTRGAIDTLSLRSQVRGRLGEWISLGGFDSAHSNDSRALTGTRSTNTASLTGLAIRVELAE